MSGKITVTCKYEPTGEPFTAQVEGTPEHKEAMYKYCMSDLVCKKVVIAEYNTVDQDGVPTDAKVIKLECL